MNRFTKTAAIAAIATLGIFGTTGAASAATINHGQCVSGAVKAGVEGAAFTAIAKNNSLVRRIGPPLEDVDSVQNCGQTANGPGRDFPPGPFHARMLVGAAGFEPTTTSPPGWCATRLRHAPTGPPV